MFLAKEIRECNYYYYNYYYYYYYYYYYRDVILNKKLKQYQT